MKDKDIELITGFLENDLNDREIEEFKARYGHELEFTSEVNERSEIYISLEAASRVSLRNMTEKPLLRQFIDDRTPPVKTGNRVAMKWIFRIAAVIVPLIAFTIGMQLKLKTGISDDLFMAYLPATADGLNRSFAIRQNNNFQAQKGDFQSLQKEIDNAILATLDIITEVGDIHDFGLFCMKEQRFAEAIFAFRRVIGMNDKNYTESSEWYLGLCYVKSGDQVKAKQVFSSIAGNPVHKFYGDSKKILRKIN